MVIDNEIAGQVLRIAHGFEVSDETLALDAIKEIAPGGNYLMHEHTLRHFRSELWQPRLADRSARDTWEAAGAKTILQRAKERAAELLTNHHPKPLPEDRLKQVAAVVGEICEREGCLDWWERHGG